MPEGVALGRGEVDGARGQILHRGRCRTAPGRGRGGHPRSGCHVQPRQRHGCQPDELAARIGAGVAAIDEGGAVGRVGVASGRADGLVERLVLGRRDLGVPVTPAGQDLPRRSGPPARPTEEQCVEDAGRGDVEEDLGQVLAADQVHVIDPEVDGGHLVARGAAGSLPLDHLGQASPQAIAGGQEGLPVGPGGVELGVVGATGPEAVEALPHLGRQAVHHGRARPHGLVDTGQPQHPQPRAELGHRGPVARHARILPLGTRPEAPRGAVRVAVSRHPAFSRRTGGSAAARAVRPPLPRQRATRCSRRRRRPSRSGR